MIIFTNSKHEEQCPVCGFKMSDLLSYQKMGCNFCYLFLSEDSKKLIRAVQDDATVHVGKKPQEQQKLLKQFFDYIIDEEMKTGDSNSSDCKKLKKLLNDYF